jgi:hypothetical protein
MAHGHTGTARLGIGRRSACGPARPVSTVRGGGAARRRHCTAAPTDARETAEERGGSPARGRRRRASGEAARRRTGRRRLQTTVVGTEARGERRAASTVGASARGARRAGGRCEAVGAVDAARSGRHLSPRARVRTAPPAAANHGSARHDTATDRRAPHVSRVSNLNKSPWMKIAQRK